MKSGIYRRLILTLAAVLLTVPGCEDLSTSGSPIAGAPDGVAEVLVVSESGAIEMQEIGFLTAVERQDQKLVLVDFWAPWCGPCLQMAPSLVSLKEKWGDKLEVVKVDVDHAKNSGIASHLHIDSIPNVRIFRGGVQVSDFVGVMPKDEIDALLRSLQ
ncbi:MAG: thioredoxin family protein [Planctomycetota bacterium]|nr:thioredoxin family protein [Planctomycetota bacterium]